MFTVALTLIAVALSATALVCLSLRWMLHSDVSEYLAYLEGELNEFEWRFERLAGHASNHSLGLSSESTKAIVEGREIIDQMKNFTEYLRTLVVSPNDRNWHIAEELLTSDIVRVKKQTLTTVDRNCFQNWKHRLEACIQTIGSDVLRASEICRRNFRPIHEKAPTQVRDLVELGVRSAVNRMNIEIEKVKSIAPAYVAIKNQRHLNS